MTNTGFSPKSRHLAGIRTKKNKHLRPIRRGSQSIPQPENTNPDIAGRFMDFNDVTGLFKEDLAKLEGALRQNYKTDVPLIPGIGNYLMDGGGKRFRPLLVMLSTKLCGREIDDFVINTAA